MPIFFMVRKQPKNARRELPECLDQHVGQTHHRNVSEPMGHQPILWPGPWEQHFAKKRLHQPVCRALAVSEAVLSSPPKTSGTNASLIPIFRWGNRLTEAYGICTRTHRPAPHLMNLPIQFLVRLDQQIALNAVVCLFYEGDCFGYRDFQNLASSIQTKALCRNPEYTVSNPGG